MRTQSARERWQTLILTGSGLGLVTLLAWWPMVRALRPPTVGDGLLHFYRLTALAHSALEGGQWYPRWSPELGYGYGLPLFNFYPPLSYWPPTVLMALGVNTATALLIGYGLALLLLVSGAYALGWGVHGAAAGWAAAVAVAGAPYVLFNLYHRGAYPELWGLGLAAWALALMWRLCDPEATQSARVGWGLALAGVVGAQLLTHALSVVMALPLMGVVGLARAGRQWRVLGWPIGFLTLAGGLGMAFWWPVLQEARFVQLSRTTADAAFAVQNNFLALGELFSEPVVYDLLRVFNVMPISVSVVVVGVGLVGVFVQRRQAVTWWLVGLAVVLAGLTLPFSAGVWQVFTPLAYLQFPWRWVGPLSVVLAVLAGGAIQALSGRWQVAGLVVMTLAVGLTTMGWSFGPAAVDLSSKTWRDIPTYEIETGQLGTTSSGEYLSIWATTPPPRETFAAAYATGALPLARVSAADMPDGVTILAEAAGWRTTTVVYAAQRGFDLTLPWLFFPDVRASVDGVPLTVRPDPVTGMVEIEGLPAGQTRQTLRVWSVASGPQRLAGWVSGGLWLGWLAAGIGWLWHQRRGRPSPEARATAPEGVGWLGGSVVAAVAVLLLARAVWLDAPGSPVYYSQLQADGTVRDSQPLDINFGDELRLIGYAQVGETVVLYWQPLRDLTTDYSVAVFIEDAQGYRYAQHDAIAPGGLPTRLWRVGQYAQDVHPIAPVAGTPAGNYRVWVSVYHAEGALEIRTAGGGAGQLAEVGQFRVETTVAGSLAAFGLENSAKLHIANLALMRYDIDRVSVTPGGEFYLVLYWEAVEDIPPGMDVTIELRSADGAISLHTGPVSAHSTLWLSGEQIRGPQRVRVPGDFPPGTAQISLIIAEETLRLGTIEVRTP